MHIYTVKNRRLLGVVCTTVCLLLAYGVVHTAHAQYVATTTVSLTVCGDGVVSGMEFCDDGSNTGAYASSIATRNCDPLCREWGPYCGDSITHLGEGEECDDGNNTAGDICDASCQNEQDPVTVGGGGSGSTGGGGGRGSGNRGIPGASRDGEISFEGDTDVIIRGTAYPGATITILRDGDIERVVEADGDGVFDYVLTAQTPGITTFGFWALDRASRRSITYSATFQIVQNAVTTLAGILIPPTLVVVPDKVPPGGNTSFEGTAVPNTRVQAYVDDTEDPEVTIAASDGVFTIVHDTAGLTSEAFHTVKANYISTTNSDLKSGFSQIVSYYVGVNDVDTNRTADLNFDGSVNLTDFSILLFHWNTANVLADINQDGTVSLADFSIMLFYWTG